MNTPYFFEHITTDTDYESDDLPIVSIRCEWKPSHRSGRTKAGNNWDATAYVQDDGSFKMDLRSSDCHYYVPFGRYDTLMSAIHAIRSFENDGEFGDHLASLNRSDFTIN